MVLLQRHRRRRRRAFCALGLALVVWCCALGCNLAPKCAGPCPPPVPSEYQSESAPPPNCADDLTCWWKQLHDPVLDRLIQTAACQNLSLQEACLRVFEAREQLRVVRGSQLPKLAGTSSFGHKRTSVNANQFIIPPSLQRPFDLYSFGFDSGWEVGLWGKYRNALAAANADINVSVEKLRDVKVTLLGDVAASYVAFRTLQQRLAIAQENLAIQGQTVELVRARLRAGLVRDLDFAQAQSNYHTTAAAVPPLEEQMQITLNRLAVLMGLPPDRRLWDIVGRAPLPLPPGDLGLGMPAELLRRRPDIRQVEFETLAAGARIGIARADLYPQLSLKGTLTLDSRQVNNWFTGSSLAFSFGPSVRWDVLNFGRLRANVRVQEQRFNQALARYQNSVLTALQEVENGVTSFHRQRQRVVELEKAVAATREAVRLSQASYRNDLVAFQSVLDSQRQLANLQEQLAQSQGQVVLAAVQTYKAAGGGWNARFECSQAGKLNLADAHESESPPPPPVPPQPPAENPSGSVAPAPEPLAKPPASVTRPIAPQKPASPPAPAAPAQDTLPNPPDSKAADALPLTEQSSPLRMNPYIAILAPRATQRVAVPQATTSLRPNAAATEYLRRTRPGVAPLAGAGAVNPYLSILASPTATPLSKIAPPLQPAAPWVAAPQANRAANGNPPPASAAVPPVVNTPAREPQFMARQPETLR